MTQPLNQNKMKQVLIFLSVFLFIQICEIYIVGGFYHQTIVSKFVSVFSGIIVSIFTVLILEDKP